MKLPSFYSAGAFAGILIVSLLYLSGCKKAESTTPGPTLDLSSQMIGQYGIDIVTITNAPAGVTINPASVTVTVENYKNALDAVLLTTAYSNALVSETGTKTQRVGQSKTVRLEQSGTDVVIYDSGVKVGYWRDGTLNLVNFLMGSSTLNLTAVKR